MKKKPEKQIIGWREWVELPELGIKQIKAKVDSGARTASLHAFDMKVYKRGKNEFVKFSIHPVQKSGKNEIICHAKILEYRKVKSSNGATELRPVILTPLRLMGEEWEIEVTLTNRDEMGFRMLLGRKTIRTKFLIDTNRSFLGKKK